jgi:molybdopterin-guanine dinucleotide biosynthesis protein MobB
MRVLHVAGPSGSGKTQLIEQLSAHLPVVQVVKWTHHPLLQDKPGSDTSRFDDRGIHSTMLAAPDGIVWRHTVCRTRIYQMLANWWSDTDLVVVEGDKYNPHPKIWVGQDLPPHTVNVCLVIGPASPEPGVAWIASEIPLRPGRLDLITQNLLGDWVHFTYTVPRRAYD